MQRLNCPSSGLTRVLFCDRSWKNKILVCFVRAIDEHAIGSYSMSQDHQQPNTTMCSSTDELHSPVITIGIAGGSGGGKVRMSPSNIHFFENYE